MDADALAPPERALVRAVAATLAALVFLCKLAVPGNIEVGFFPVMALAGWLFARGHARLLPGRTLAFCLIGAGAVAVTLFSPRRPDWSAPSLAFLLVMHLPFLLACDVRRPVYLAILRWFTLIAQVVAGMVFLQWAQQLAGQPMLDMERWVPRGLLFQHYNYIQKVDYFSRFTKPNGFFLLETSHCSQLLAMAALTELGVLRRMGRALLLATAAVLTFGGTGMFIGVVLLPLALLRLSPRRLVLAAGAGVAVVAAGWLFGVWDNAAGRIGGLGRVGSSGNGRFVMPYVILARTLAAGGQVLLFGYGAGVPNPFIVSTHADILTAPVKMVSDYGLLVGLAWVVWFHWIVFAARAPLVVTLAVLLQYEGVGGGLLIPLATYYVLILAALFRPAAKPERNASSAWGWRPPSSRSS